MWLNLNYMSGEQITNNSVETQNMEGELHSLKNSSSKKKRVDINVLLNKVRLAQKKRKNGINNFLWIGCSSYSCNWNNSFYLRKKNNIINS